MNAKAKLAHQFDDAVIIPAHGQQLNFGFEPDPIAQAVGSYFDAPTIDLDDYDRIVVCASGGKDSIACLLALIELGVDMSVVEL